MKKTSLITLLFAVATLSALYVGCGQSAPNAPKANVLAVAAPSSRLPQDVLQSCTISNADFASWFASGKITENGLTVPANSVTFGHNNNCDFYTWSWQMFSWLTSPISGSPTTGFKTVMESQVFYTVSPADSKGNRVLIPHDPSKPLEVSSSITQVGPHQLPTIIDKKGRLFEVERQAPKVKPMLLLDAKNVVAHKVDIDANGKPVFKDQSGKVINNPKAMLATKENNQNVVQEIKASNGKSVFLTANGEIIESEEGQAGGGHGLMSQGNSVVYYITMVNDVFAFYLVGASNNVFPGAQFPTTAAERDAICNFARSKGAVLPDSNALAMEIKTSWVEASSLSDPQNYVTIDAVIPTYNKTDTLWTPSGKTTVKLALLGVHVVGSTAGHPEMVWATFEQQKNAPNASYQYLNTQRAVVTVPQDGGSWTISSNGNDPKPNIAHFAASGNTLKAETGFTISPSNSLASFPWGTALNGKPNAEDGTSAASNSEVISINNSVLGWFVGNDIRKNYLLIGATWTSGGVAPSGTSFATNPTDPGAAIGTSLLANTTMETYKQSSSNSCFTCHSGSPASLAPDILSHVYGGIEPVIPGLVAPKK